MGLAKKLKNNTRNQHYISQCEQKFNSINPENGRSQRKIYSFSIKNSESFDLILDDPFGTKIENNLSSKDLYTFKELDSENRYNFELFFRKYEDRLHNLTVSLIKKTREGIEAYISDELREIFALKLLNSFRNPYRIKVTLEIIGVLSKHRPVDESSNNIYQKIEQNRNDYSKSIAEEFGVNEDEYVQWIKSLFILLCLDIKENKNILDLLIENVFTSKQIRVNIDYYADKNSENYVVLPDTGYVKICPNPTSLIYQFNLSANILLSYIIQEVNMTEFAQSEVNMPIGDIQKIISQITNIHYQTRINNLETLSEFNKLAISQSHSKVFCKGKTIYLGN